MHNPVWQGERVAAESLPAGGDQVNSLASGPVYLVIGWPWDYTCMLKLNTQLTDLLLDLPWGRITTDLWELGKQFLGKLRGHGMYAVLVYESELEIHDPKGVKATFRKRQKVRYLQDHIIAYQDQAWGDGQILQRYRCSPGKPVDRYRLGHKTHILISLREVKNRGDQDQFNLEWGIKDGFLHTEEQWETEISHPTNHLVVKLLFPKERFPKRVVLFESDRQRSTLLPSTALQALPDSRTQVTWEQKNPRLHERYILKWTW